MWVNWTELSEMVAHFCRIEQNILMCHCPFLYDTPARCSPKWQESPQTATHYSGQILRELGEETTNLFICSCSYRTAIVTVTSCVWLYDYMLRGASYLMFSTTYQNTRNDVFKKISYEGNYFRHVLRYACPKILQKISQRFTNLLIKDSKTLHLIKTPFYQEIQTFLHRCCSHTDSWDVTGSSLCRAIFEEWKHERPNLQNCAFWTTERNNNFLMTFMV